MDELARQVWAVDALGALAHETRLSVFRMLVKAGPDGLVAGDIASGAGVPPSTMSHHLSTLERAGLVTSERESRLIRYRADYAGMKRLLTFLMQDCCGGVPEMCADLAGELEWGEPESGTRPMGGEVVIYHNPECGTSRNALAMIRNAGIEPHVIEYLKTPPSRAMLEGLIKRAGLTPRDLLREKGTPYAELGLDDTGLTDAQLLDAMMEHPILINRPLVVSPLGVKLCRPSEAVLDLLPARQAGAFAKEDGEQVVDADGRRLR